jgi:hypothetical protein
MYMAINKFGESGTLDKKNKYMNNNKLNLPLFLETAQNLGSQKRP